MLHSKASTYILYIVVQIVVNQKIACPLLLKNLKRPG